MKAETGTRAALPLAPLTHKGIGDTPWNSNRAEGLLWSSEGTVMTAKDHMRGLVELPEGDLQAAERMVRGVKQYAAGAETAPLEAFVRQATPGEALPLFDAQAGFGGASKGDPTTVSADDCLRAMAKVRVHRALVRTEPDTLAVDPLLANDLLLEACEVSDSLVPCPIVLPATGGDVPPEADQVDHLIRCGAGAAMVRPAQDDWQWLPFVYTPLMNALSERRLPLFCIERHVSLGQVADVAARFPDLPIIVANVGYRAQRTLVPLLATYRNVHLSLGSNWTVHRGIEQMVEWLGPEQLLFGTGFPAAEPMMAITQLMYAEISEEARALIGSGNLERLWSGVKR